VSGSGVTGSSISGASDTQIQAMVTIDVNSLGGSATVTATSNGYGGSGFLGNPGQSNNNSVGTSIEPIAAPPPTIMYFGQAITGTQSAYTGQQIALTTFVNLPVGATTASNSWTVPGTSVAEFNASLQTGQAVELTTVTNPSITFYWVAPGQNMQVTYSYCLANNQCNSATATFNVGGPTGYDSSSGVRTTTGSVWVGWLKDRITGVPDQQLTILGVPVSGGQVGIEFQALGQLPQNNQGQYSWIQLINNDVLQVGDNGVGGRGACTPLAAGGGLASYPILDTNYPYSAVLQTNGVPNDTATDNPGKVLSASNGSSEWFLECRPKKQGRSFLSPSVRLRL
jgi:hypothetical protein